MSVLNTQRFVVLTASLLLIGSGRPPELFAQGTAKKDFPDFRNPPRAYEDVTVDGRQFIVEQQLRKEEPALARKALARLKQNIDLALALMPPHAHEHVAKQKFWLMYGPKSTNGGKNNGLAYFRPGSPKFDARRDERWNSVVVVFHAQNYAGLTDLWALKSVVHELGHAYQLEQWPEKQPEILAAWEHAMAEGLYRNVENNKGGVFEKAYAMTNQLEYFAELTAMYFARCNYQPYNRSELKEYDPVGHRMIRQMWKVGKEFGEATERTWYLGKSRRPLKGTFQSMSNGRVTVLDDAGRERTLSLRVLSPADQEYIGIWLGE